MASLVHALKADCAAAASGTAEFYSMGTATVSSLVYSDPNGLTPVTTHALNAYGRITRYVGEPVDVVIKNAAGATVDTFTHIEDGRVVRVETAPFSGPNTSGNGQTVVGGRTTATAALAQVGLSGATIATGSFGVYNVVSYGANRLGGADATTAINSAISAASAAGGGVVYYPAGTYYMTGIVTTAVNIRHVGDGIGVTTLKNYSTTNDAFFFSQSAATDTNSGVYAMSITANTASAGAGIFTRNARFFTISDVKVSGHGAGIYINADSASTQLHTLVERCQVSVASLAAPTAAFFARARDITFRRCYALGGAASGTDIGFESIAQYTTFVDCVADSCATGTAIGFYLTQSNATVLGCRGVSNDTDCQVDSALTNINLSANQFATVIDASSTTSFAPRVRTSSTSSASATFTVSPTFATVPSDVGLHFNIVGTYAVAGSTGTIDNPVSGDNLPIGTIIEFTVIKTGANDLTLSWGTQYRDPDGTGTFGGLTSVTTNKQASVRFRLAAGPLWIAVSVTPLMGV